MLNPAQFERRVRATGAVAVLGLAAIFVALSYWQVFRTDLAEEETNPRVLRSFHDPNRGSILDRNGTLLAESLPDGTRRYTDASVAQVLGYLDPRYGSQGVELAFNAELAGEVDPDDPWRAALDTELLREPASGLDVTLTIDMRIQAAAAQALGSRKGAVVVLDPRNGDVLAMVSVPTYDPGGLEENGEALLADPDSPLLNRATQGLYTPGSTFKTVTAAAALEHRVIAPNTKVTCPGEIVVDGFPISCSNVSQGVGTYPFSDAFAFSVNAIFAEVGGKVGWDRLIQTASKFGFGRSLDFALDTAPTHVVPEDAERSKVLLATTSFGQGEILVTPLQMALVAATIANDGVMARPRIGLSATAEGGQPRGLEGTSSTRVLDAGIARQIRDMMVAVVAKGQAAGVDAKTVGVQVAGKTGTAETGRDTSHAWFIAFAPAEAPTLAVAVVVEDGGRGGEVASPIAGQIIRLALAR